MELQTIILGITLFFNAIVTGLFWGWNVSVIPGTKLLGNREYLDLMQKINNEIINPYFLSIFVLSPVLLVFSTVLHVGENNFWFLIAASIFYIVGQFVVTAAGNVPLNNRLEDEDLQDLSIEELGNVRSYYEGPWNRFQTIRAINSLIGLTFLLIAISI